MGPESVKEAVEDDDQVMDFVTLGMFIIGMLSRVSLPRVFRFLTLLCLFGASDFHHMVSTEDKIAGFQSLHVNRKRPLKYNRVHPNSRKL